MVIRSNRMILSMFQVVLSIGCLILLFLQLNIQLQVNNNNNKNKNDTVNQLVSNHITKSSFVHQNNNKNTNKNNITILIGTHHHQQQQQQNGQGNNDYNNINNVTIPNSPNRTILFVHIGKAGGETIKRILHYGCSVMGNKKQRTKCYTSLPNNTYLSQHTIGYYHCFKIQPINVQKKVTSYLYIVRHPLERIISWYNYIHPMNCNKQNPKLKNKPNCFASTEYKNNPNGFIGQFFYKCFPTVEHWALALTNSAAATTTATTRITTNYNNVYNNQSCNELGQIVLSGQMNWTIIPLAAHMIANYKDYTDHTTKVYPKKEILIVRTDSMWNDLKQLDILLGGNGNFGIMDGYKTTHGSDEYMKHHIQLSNSSKQLFCCSLLYNNELYVYKFLIDHAINLHEQIKQETIILTAQRCGYNTWDTMIQECYDDNNNHNII